MSVCCIEGCKTSKQRDVMLFEFPTSRVLRKRWLDAISPVSKPSGDARVCLRHFETCDYEAVRGRVRLRAKVVPTLFGEQAKSPEPPKDPLDTNEKESQESTNKDHNGKVDNDNEKVDSDNDKVDIGKCDSNDEKDKETCDTEKDKDASKDTTENGHEATIDNALVNDNDKVDNDNGKVDNDNGKVDNDNGKVVNDNEKVAKAGNKRTASKVTRKVKKKWVPMRKRPDNVSESEDSVNSDLPTPPLLEDLEEHLPNYQIANLKTERQVAAMTVTDPEPEPRDVQDLVSEPHEPVFIELSVGEGSNQPGPGEQPNDCLMVLESVQCDIDPTLMLEARAEDEECCEQIDLDDDDDDDDEPLKTITKTPTDPISLLTSSDEDDVIIQEPHIDTLSVSDETDEDDLPLQKLIKKEKKAKKLKKKKKIKPVQSILVGVTDFYCYHCQHISESRSAHDKHVKTHLNDIDEQTKRKTRVYQICKECGFTTSSKSQLHRHQKKHLKEKRYKCPLCSYRSKYNMSLMYHLKTHDFIRAYSCSSCGVGLDSKKALLKHQLTCYVAGEKLSCDECGFEAQTKRAMKLHTNMAHK